MRIKKLDGLRGFFSVLIVFLHYNRPYLPGWFNNFFINNTYVFVDFFFILSGFVISYNYYSILVDYKTLVLFFIKRIIRLYPLHIFSSLIYFTYIIVSRKILTVYFPSYFSGVEFSYNQHIEPFVDAIFLTNSTPFFGVTNGTNDPSWSVSAEMITYLAFAFITVFFTRKFNKIIFAIIIIISALLLYEHGTFFETGKFGFLRSFIGFFLGFIIFDVSNKKHLIIPSYVEFFIPATVVLYLFILDSFKFSQYSWFLSFICPILFSCLIFLLLYSDGLLSKLLESNLLQYLGRLSYSIYLNHYFFGFVFVKSIYAIFEIGETALSKIIIFSFVFLIIISYSALTYNLIEVKIGNYLKRKVLKWSGLVGLN